MNKFSFKYNTILEYKKKSEDHIKSKLSGAMDQLDKETKKLQVLNDNKSNCHDDMNQLITTGVQISQLKNYNCFINALNSKISTHKTIIKKQNYQIEVIRSELANAAKEVKVFEKLKENHLTEYQYLEKKEEEKFIDQLVTYKSYVK